MLSKTSLTMTRTQCLSQAPCRSSILTLLKSCIKHKDLEKGIKIHSEIIEGGLLLDKNCYVANTLISLYTKCGELNKAREVFDQLPHRNLVSWNSLISGYVQHDHPMEAFNCLDNMEHSGLSPDSVTFVCILKACGSIGASEKGEEIHAYIAKERLLERNLILSNALMDMYAKCGDLVKAQEVFNHIQMRDEISWNTLITGYARHRHSKEVLECHGRMQLEGFSLNTVSFLATLKGCGTIELIKKGMETHAKIVKEEILESNILVGSALVDMYAKCGAIYRAQEVFDKLYVWNVVSWNSLIGGYVQQGHGERALHYFERMKREGVIPDSVTFVCALKACGSIGACTKGRDIHDEVVREGLLGRDHLVLNALVDMYAKCGAPLKGKEIFDEFGVRNIVSWNVLISGYAQYSYGEEALEWFQRMQCESMLPNEVTFICILKACRSTIAIMKGKEIHARDTSIEHNILIGTALVDMYVKCGALMKAQDMFDRLHIRNVISWNALIGGYAQHEHIPEALNCFEQMQCEGLSPDAVSWNALIAGYAQHGHSMDALMWFECMKYEGFSPDGITYASILKVCGDIRAIDKGRKIHEMIVREEFIGKSTLVLSALVDMYGKCGELETALQIFDAMTFKSTASWTALITGYVQHERFDEALDYFDKMQHDGFSPNNAIFLSILKASGSIGDLNTGESIHAKIVKGGLLMKSDFIGNALVDMYAKCGVPSKAHDVFYHIQVRDVVSWSTLITAYAQLGDVTVVIDLFNKMLVSGVRPDSITFSALLKTCSHCGLLEEAQMYYEIMSTCYDIVPTLEHQTCMVDLFGRAGHFEKAVKVMKTMLNCDSLPMWLSLLGACQKWGDLKLGRQVFEHVVELDEMHGSAYVCMGNIYAAASMQEDVERPEE